MNQSPAVFPLVLKVRRGLVLALSICLISSQVSRAQMVDQNHNGMSDIWELLYGASGLAPGGDADGDGASNLTEAIAGTNPFDSTSVPKINGYTNSTNGFIITYPGAAGKLYSLQSTTNLAATNWVTETNMVLRPGGSVIFTGTNSPRMKLFRIAIADVDTDGDGVNDWEEYQLGLNPLNPTSNGTLNTNGQLLNDYQYVVGMLAQQNVITVVASDNTAMQPATNQTAQSTGSYLVSRGGFPLTSLFVSLTTNMPGPGVATAGIDYLNLPSLIYFAPGQSSQTVVLTPLANTNLLAPAVATLQVIPSQVGSSYSIGQNSNASVIIYPAANLTGTGLTGLYYTNTSAGIVYTNAVNFNPAYLKITRLDSNINFTWNSTNPPIAGVSNYYCVRWIGQIQPQFSETYTFDANTDDGLKLWVNDQLIINDWTNKSASDVLGTITLQAGVRYDIQMDYLQVTGNAVASLSWYSPSQPKQIIPASNLYPTNSTPPPSTIISSLYSVGFLGQPFSYSLVGDNLPTSYSASGLPMGLTLNTTNGLVSGTPGIAGTFQAFVTASNNYGLSSAALTLQIFNTGSSVVQELWTNLPGTNVADIPADVIPANSTNLLGTLQGVSNLGDNYGERVRGYFTAPVTGNYYFWLAGSDSAELWISDDNQSADMLKRCWVTPVANGGSPNILGTAPLQWTLQTNQQSPWLSLVAGQQYFIQVLHKAGVGTNDNWSVGYLFDTTGTNSITNGVAGSIVPGYLLSRYYPTPPAIIPGTLYTANLLPMAGVNSTASGSATLVVSADGSSAVLNISTANLSSAITSEHIDSDPYLNYPAVDFLYDISDSPKQPNGSYLWYITGVSPLAASDVLEIISEGKASVTVHTANYPNGEISAHFTLADGSQTFTAPPAPPAWTDDHANSNSAARFLIQATFGPTTNDIALVQSIGYSNWIQNQFSLPATYHLPVVLGNPSPDPTDPYPSTLWFSTWWQQSVSAPDQLRQRVAFALSEIMVTSENGTLANNYGHALASYYDMLLDNAFGNYRNLLESVSLHPAMGVYLNMQGNAMGSMITGVHANENYAREIEQLFSVGLNRLWPDGTLILNSQGALVPTYNQNVVMGFASTFTGWNFYQTNQTNGRLPTTWTSPTYNYTNPMTLFPSQHEQGTKLLLDNVVLPAAQGAALSSSNVAYDAYGLNDLEKAHNNIFNNPNVGPFICRQLIQRLVTSSPSRDYVYRVASVFNNDGTGVRGNMKAVIQAILLDYDARSQAIALEPGFGKQRESLLKVTALARAFPAPPTNSGTYSQNNTNTITITTASPHLMNSGDSVQIYFTDGSGQPAPPTQSAGYSVSVTGPSSFNITAPYLTLGSYVQTNSVITVSNSGHGLAVGNSAYVAMTTGGGISGSYVVASVIDANHYTVPAQDNTNRSGVAYLPKLTGGGFAIASKTNMTVYTSEPHGLVPGNSVFMQFTEAGSPTNGVYTVLTVPDSWHFTAIVSSNGNGNYDDMTIYPLAAPSLTRSGTVALQQSTWNMGYTDGGGTASLTQSPLRSPTVFNYFYPGYMDPGTLASAGLTTPEFQLSSDSSIASEMNFIENAVLNSTRNTNGVMSFINDNGSVVMSVQPYMTAANVSSNNIGGLVDTFNTLLTGGQLSSGARSNIISYVNNTTNFPTNSATLIRDKVETVVHQIVASPDFNIQK